MTLASVVAGMSGRGLGRPSSYQDGIDDYPTTPNVRNRSANKSLAAAVCGLNALSRATALRMHANYCQLLAQDSGSPWGRTSNGQVRASLAEHSVAHHCSMRHFLTAATTTHTRHFLRLRGIMGAVQAYVTGGVRSCDASGMSAMDCLSVGIPLLGSWRVTQEIRARPAPESWPVKRPCHCCAVEQ